MPVILAFQSSPADELKLELDLEVREINKAIAPFAKRDLQIIQLGAVKVSDIPEYLLEYQPDIFHFGGHGATNGDLIFVDNNGEKQPIDSNAMELLFGYLGASIKCVVLSSCFSAKQARRIARYIPFVIGNSSEVFDDLSILFSANFYRSLSYGMTIPRAFEIAKAVISAVDQSPINSPSMISGPPLDPAEAILFTQPMIKACFFLDENKQPKKRGNMLKMKVWVDNLPEKTISVVYNFNHDSILDDMEEILNDGTGTDTWTTLYGNVQLRVTIWFTNEGIGIVSSMVEALKNYYHGKKLSASVKSALDYIETH
jgi:hypothetical protein